MKSRQPLLAAAAAAALMLTAPGVRAQDEARPFTGFYVGPEAGISIIDANPGSSAELYYGGRLGYRYQTESGWVFGLEARAGDTTFSERGSLFGVPLRTKLGRSLGGEALVGYALGEGRRHLLFVGGGFDNSRLKISAGGQSSGTTDTTATILAGYEWAVSDRLSLRLGGQIIQPNGLREGRITGGLFLRF
ncbi:MAG: porin family protein [Alphaproteobacteria bacterium]|nr:MAG: porin family protein [Alphaproteobacteria bacterium]